MSYSTLFSDYEVMLVSAVAGVLGYFFFGQVESAWSLAFGFCAGIGVYSAFVSSPKFEKHETTEVETKIAA